MTNRNDDTERPLSGDEKSALLRELNWCDKMSATEALKLISLNPRIYSINYKQLEGNTTNASLLKSFMSVVDVTGHDSEAIEDLPASKRLKLWKGFSSHKASIPTYSILTAVLNVRRLKINRLHVVAPYILL